MSEPSPDAAEPDETPWTRPAPETILFRALRLRCPRCGEGNLFQGWFHMSETCQHCQFVIQRPAGYYLGSTYINYGITAIIVTAAFLIGRFGFHLSSDQLLIPLMVFCLIFPVLLFRHARALWLALDCQFDRSVLEETRRPTE